MTIKRTAFILLTLLIAAALCACGSDPEIGKWKRSAADGSQIIIELKDDKTGTISVINTSFGEYEANGNELTLKDCDIPDVQGESAVYSIDGKTLTIDQDEGAITFTR